MAITGIPDTDLPQLSSCLNTSSAYTMADWTGPYAMYPGNNFGVGVHSGISPYLERQKELEKYKYVEPNRLLANKSQILEEKVKPMITQRVVQVFILDPDKSIPLDKRLLYTGPQHFTDMSDQDLFFDVEIKSILSKHNEYRLTVLDKKKSTTTEKVYLEAVRVSELKMVVSVVAQF